MKLRIDSCSRLSQDINMGEIRSHTGLRGVAALFVLFRHLQLFGPHLPFEDATLIFARSYLMVDLFFILSGFIITYVYSRQVGPNMNYRSFMTKRLIRLFPLHLFCLSILLIGLVSQNVALRFLGKDFNPLFTPDSTVALISQIFLLNAWYPSAGAWNIPTWSISAEIFAYALFPAIVFLTFEVNRKRRLALLVGSLIFYAFIAYTTGSLDITAGLAPMRCLAGFVLGVLIHAYRNSLPDLSIGSIGVLQFLALSGSTLALALPLNDVFVIPFFALLVYSTWSDKGWLSSFFGGNICHYLGRISYSVYLTHYVVILLLYPTWTAIASRLSSDPLALRGLWIFVVLAVVLVSSHFTYHWVEEPSRRWLTKRLVPN